MAFGYKDFRTVPTYQPDFYGWGLRTVDRVGDWLTQDEINLIMGGTAANCISCRCPIRECFRKDVWIFTAINGKRVSLFY